MSWSVYDELIEFRAGASRAMGAWLVTGHLLAAASVLLAGLSASLLFLVALSLPWTLRAALRPLGRDTRAISWSVREGWARVGIRTNREPMELRGSSVVTNDAMFLHWDAGGKSWRIVLPRDAMQADDWRRMKVIVGFYQGRDRMRMAASIATRTGRTLKTAPGLSKWRLNSPGFRGACPDGHEKQRPVAGGEGPAR